MADCIKTIDKIKPSIALVSVLERGSFVAQGSGFVFSENRLVTCYHVVSDFVKGNANKILLTFANSLSTGGLPIEATVDIIHESNDIAVLKFNDKSRLPIPTFNGEIKEGLSVIFSGFPLGLRALTTHQGIISSITIDSAGAKRYLIDGTVNTGNSGCPLMTIDGELIGIINATQREDRDLLNQVAELSEDENHLVLYGIDLIKVYQAIIKNLQLGIGYAVPCSYIPRN
jgi:serine protease Do